MKNYNYKGQVAKILNVDPLSDMINMEDDQPELIFGPALEGQFDDSDVAPFYISVRLHDYVLHNAIFGLGASNNLMPKVIMEKLGLDITRKYHDLYSFDSGRIRCIGLIKVLDVSLDQIPVKNVLMDVVVTDIPPRFGMLLSRSWGAKLKGSLQLDFSYATILVFGQMRKLYREKKMKYMITSKEKPMNHPINYVHTDLESFVLYFDSFNDVNSQLVEVDDITEITENFRAVLHQERQRLENLKEYNKSIIQHVIPIKPNQKPFRQKLRRINPKSLPSIEKEVNQLYKAGIVVRIRFSEWISNLVPVQKKTGEIRLCIDFRNLNKVSLKDNYPLPKMDHILQRVVGASCMSLLDGYSRYNQILVHEDDRDKTTFTTPWGTFNYAKMPFGLKNVGATFQRAMDINFANEKDVFLVVYLDDLTVFSNSDEEHLYHLKIFFQRCRKYGISLNPKKSLFAMDKGNLLGHIISKEGIRIDLAQVEAIQKIDFPRSKKEIQAFNGKMNFLHHFVPNLAEHLREITNMLKKDSVVKWTKEAIKSFNLVKLALSSTPILINPDYSQDIILFSFTSEHTMTTVLMHKRDQLEKPIAFSNKTIRDAALKYNSIEKQALALVKAVKGFRVYIFHSHILSYAPNTTIKDVLVQTDPEGRRGKWIAALL
eukprot:PITA_16371